MGLGKEDREGVSEAVEDEVVTYQLVDEKIGVGRGGRRGGLQREGKTGRGGR